MVYTDIQEKLIWCRKYNILDDYVYTALNDFFATVDMKKTKPTKKNLFEKVLKQSDLKGIEPESSSNYQIETSLRMLIYYVEYEKYNVNLI